MNEAADELERMAKEFETKCAEYRRRGNVTQKTWQHILDCAIASVHEETARRLRSRVAEIRAIVEQSPVALPKPSEVKPGQWWVCRHSSPGHVYSVAVDTDDDELCAYFRGLNGERWAKEARVMLTSPNWLYLGDGPEPAQNA